jgi:DNA-binding NarL/FixJ family response regulator
VPSSRFPLAAATAGEDPLLGAAGPPSHSLIRLLVVDDDPRVRQAIAGTIALESDLTIVAEAADATSALSMADATDPSVALVDVLLPDAVTGLALIRSLNARPTGAVIAMSVRGGLREAALAAGAVAFVEKGGDIDGLLAALRGATGVTQVPTS